MRYNLPLGVLRATNDTDRLLFALAERLEHIAELMGKQQREPQEAIESEAQAKKLLESLGYDIF